MQTTPEICLPPGPNARKDEISRSGASLTSTIQHLLLEVGGSRDVHMATRAWPIKLRGQLGDEHVYNLGDCSPFGRCDSLDRNRLPISSQLANHPGDQPARQPANQPTTSQPSQPTNPINPTTQPPSPPAHPANQSWDIEMRHFCYVILAPSGVQMRIFYMILALSD